MLVTPPAQVIKSEVPLKLESFMRLSSDLTKRAVVGFTKAANSRCSAGHTAATGVGCARND